jgi:hypothetical protein
MNLSAGAKKELLILFFCKAIFQTALERETIGSIPRERSNKTHKINNQLDRRIKSLMDKITATIDATINQDISDWMRSKTKGLLFSILTRIAQNEIQLETFGLYCLFVNFCERTQPLHSIFNEYTDANLYFDNIDLLKLNAINEDLEADMMRLAYHVISELKG